MLGACGGGNDNPMILIDGSTVDSTVADICNPLTQAGCAANEKCAWIVDQDNPRIGHIGCAPVGTDAVPVGGACMQGPAGPMGYSNCEKGSECVAGTCKTICDHQGGSPMCGENFSCSRYASLFVSGDTTVAGVCDPNCDPLTQKLLGGNMGEACGSTDPAKPTQGCFTFDSVEFSCAPSSLAGKCSVTTTTVCNYSAGTGCPTGEECNADPDAWLTDRRVARGPESGGAYVNGCAPGFLPFFREMTGSNTVVCAGMCSPLDTDNTMPANNKGNAQTPAKLPNEATSMAGNATCQVNAKGSVANQNCIYLWPFNVENGMLIESPYNDTLGLCFAYGFYTYDHDNNTGTTNRGVPGCETLPPKSAPPANCTCDAMGSCTGTGCPDGLAHQWGCYDTTTTNAFTASNPAAALKPFMREFRVGYGAGRGVKHQLVD